MNNKIALQLWKPKFVLDNCVWEIPLLLAVVGNYHRLRWHYVLSQPVPCILSVGRKHPPLEGYATAAKREQRVPLVLGVLTPGEKPEVARNGPPLVLNPILASLHEPQWKNGIKKVVMGQEPRRASRDSNNVLVLSKLHRDMPNEGSWGKVFFYDFQAYRMARRVVHQIFVQTMFVRIRIAAVKAYDGKAN